MYYIAENLELRRIEVASRISEMTGRDVSDCLKEVDLSIQRLFYWGAYADKYGGQVQVGESISVENRYIDDKGKKMEYMYYFTGDNIVWLYS